MLGPVFKCLTCKNGDMSVSELMVYQALEDNTFYTLRDASSSGDNTQMVQDLDGSKCVRLPMGIMGVPLSVLYRAPVAVSTSKSGFLISK